VPILGRNIVAVRTIAVAADDIAQSTTSLDPALPSLAPAQLRTSDGRIDVAALRAAVPGLTSLSSALTRADAAVAAIDPHGLMTPVADALGRAQDALSGSPSVTDALTVLPALLGADGQRTWAVLLLNPAEIRGGGGFFGGLAIVSADNGHLTLKTVLPNDALVGSGPLSVDTLPAEYRQLWGASAPEWQSVNLSAHFPYAAELTAAGLAKQGIAVDGVIALDTKVAAAILAGTGAVTADGFTITPAGADAFFTKGIYAAFPDGQGHKQVALDLLRQMFVALTSRPLDVRAMTKALVPLLDQRRLLAWSALDHEESALSDTALGGVVPDSAGPWTTVALVNGAGNKMDVYVTASVAYLAQSCEVAAATSSVMLRLTNSAPTGLPPYVDQRLDDPSAPKGSTQDIAFVYGPVGSQLVDAVLDGKALPSTQGTERGHPVWRFDIALLRGQSRTLVVHFTEPPSTQAPVVMAQPLANDEQVTAIAARCPS
jgi:hypothetical protein